MPFRDFRPYLNYYFIETGSYLGDGIKAALDAGFQEVISIEISRGYYEHCAMRFRTDHRVSLVHDDSINALQVVINNLDQPATFYLDGHWSGEDTGRGMMDYPLLKELEIISKSYIKNHIIIIDDVRLFDTQWKLGTVSIKEALRNINPKYILEYKDGYVKDDVLIARL